MIYIFLPAVFIGLFFLPNILSTTVLDVGGVPLLSLIIVIAAGIWELIIIIKYYYTFVSRAIYGGGFGKKEG